MTAAELQQILGLLINAGLAMSTLVIFFLARSWVRKRNQITVIEIQEGKDSQRPVLKISNKLSESMVVTELAWSVGIFLKSQLVWQKPFQEKVQIPPGGMVQLVSQGEELRTLYQLIGSALKFWPSWFARRGIAVAIRLNDTQVAQYKRLTPKEAGFLLKAAKQNFHPFGRIS